ncbi:MAG TPA: hypothetical protein PLH72_11700 [Vicinamibacterales bacterium]|nr:hypothetical protein [Vicinamibacterales bacterium]
MPTCVPTCLILIGLSLASVPAAAAQPAECDSWQACRAQVEEAIASGAVERAHDLAWRAVQKGPKDDPSLMFLLARAQSLSGRPADALVMVRRLAERGVPTEADAHPDLARMRALPGWLEVQGMVARAPTVLAGSSTPATGEDPGTLETSPGLKPRRSSGSAGTSPGLKPRRSGPVVAPPRAQPDRPERRGLSPERRGFSPGDASAPGDALALVDATPLVEERVRFSGDRFATAGLAYDAVSHRYLLGDRDGRKVRVVGEGLDEAVDLVRSESAGFGSVRALAIDTRRGDLWVASADEAAGTAALHRLQLISGRPLKVYPLGGATGLSAPIDLAVTPAGAVLVLDARGRLARLMPGAESTGDPLELGVAEATSIAVGASETQAFVAYRMGILRVNLSSGAAARLSEPAGVALGGFLRLRRHRDGLVGLQSGDDGTARLVRLTLASSARGVQSATYFDIRIDATGGPVTIAVSGDEIALVGDPPTEDGRPETGATALVVRRVRLH